MTNQQKGILAVLATVAAFMLVSLSCAVALLLFAPSSLNPVSAPEAVAHQLPTATRPPTPDPTSTSPPPATAAAAPAALPTPTNTRVVSSTPLPTPTATPVNCINKIENFEATGLITNEEVKLYLSETIPAAHLDHCRIIKYVPQEVSSHATPVAGSFTPMFRQIYVYSIDRRVEGMEEFLGTLTHEIGHNVHYNLRRDKWEISAQWTELHKHNGGFVSDYAQVSDFEDFAETYRAYVLQADLLRLYSPEKYEYMRLNIFQGLEYIR